MTDATIGQVQVEPRRKRPGMLRRLLRDRLATAAAIVLLLIVVAALLAPWIAPHDPYLTTRRRLLPPVWETRGVWAHVLGTDSLGRDMLSRLLYGARATLTIGVAATAIGGAIGIAVGLLAAYFRRLDGVLMRMNDVLLSMPAILLGLTLAAVVGPGMTAIVVALAVATVPTVARVTRGSALTIMAQDFMEAGRSIGLPDSTLIWRYLALNCISPVLVYLTLRFAQTILIGAVLSFLGLGAQAPAAELGMMASSGAQRTLHRAACRHNSERRHHRHRAVRERAGRRPARSARPEAAQALSFWKVHQGRPTMTTGRASLRHWFAGGRDRSPDGRRAGSGAGAQQPHDRAGGRLRPLRSTAFDGARRIRGPLHARRHARVAGFRHEDREARARRELDGLA